MGEELHLGICLYLFCVADGQFTGHILQLGQGSVQAVFPLRGFRCAGLRLCQWAQEPQNGLNLLCDLSWKLTERISGVLQKYTVYFTTTTTVCDIYPFSVLAPAWSLPVLP